MNKLSRTVALVAIAGFAVAAQTTAGSAIQWPWKRDRGTEEIVLPPPAEGLPPGDVILLPPATSTKRPLRRTTSWRGSTGPRRRSAS